MTSEPRWFSKKALIVLHEEGIAINEHRLATDQADAIRTMLAVAAVASQPGF